METLKINLTLSLLLGALCTFGQTANPCIQEVLDYEGYTRDTSLKNKNVFQSYTVKVTDWDDESTISNVKIYKKGVESRFFSEQVNMYSDEKQIIVEMPQQKVIVVNNALAADARKGGPEDFYEARKAFLDSCQVVRCEATGNTRVLVLKVTPGQKRDGIKITDMVYEYDPALKKVLSVKTTYHPDYKLKSLLVIYRDFDSESDYAFEPFTNQFINKKGQLNARYKGYELVDVRDKKTAGKKK